MLLSFLRPLTDKNCRASNPLLSSIVMVVANRIYEALCVELKKQGLAKTEHKPIADEDIRKLYRCGVFNTENPTNLQNKVFFKIMLFFCPRSRQNLRQLKVARLDFLGLIPPKFEH